MLLDIDRPGTKILILECLQKKRVPDHRGCTGLHG